jgi:hypothetical protein
VPGVSYFWTTTEVTALREAYPAGGLPAAQEALPKRKRHAIYGKAQQLGLRAPPVLSPTAGKRFARKYPNSERIDDAIRHGYATATKRGDYGRIAVLVDRPKWWVHKRAAQLGLARNGDRRLDVWQREELAILEKYVACDIKVIGQKLRSAGFSRTPTAIGVKLKRLQLDRTDPNAWTATDLGGLLGVNRATVADWIERRGLKAKKKPRGESFMWVVQRKDLRAWIASNPRWIDLRRVDQPWFMDLVFGAAA